MAPDPENMMRLLLPMLSGVKDDYESDIVPPLPLSLDRVMEGRAPKSSSRLFQLPFEILTIILSYLSSSNLANLALVNSDCRQWARSRQYANVNLTYSDSSFGLIKVLQDEVLERVSSKSNGFTSRPSLGACIRRVTIATDSRWITFRHDIKLSREFNALPREERIQRLAKLSDFYYGSYIDSIGHLLSHRKVLPNLDFLGWDDFVPLPKQFYNELVSSNIRHLRLYRVPVEEQFEIDQLNGAWPLRSLYLELLWDIIEDSAWRGETGPLCTSILRQCAPTLESLIWVSSPVLIDPQSFGTEMSKIPRFPNLRNLDISSGISLF
ncbi:hypothetical protein B7463_g5145, partial [Scytalidium lignicola]